jgi:hypothetical protein
MNRYVEERGEQYAMGWGGREWPGVRDLAGAGK